MPLNTCALIDQNLVNMTKVQGTLRNVVFDLIYCNFNTIEVLVFFFFEEEGKKWILDGSYQFLSYFR